MEMPLEGKPVACLPYLFILTLSSLDSSQSVHPSGTPFEHRFINLQLKASAPLRGVHFLDSF